MPPVRGNWCHCVSLTGRSFISAMISSKSDRRVCVFCSASGEQPNASTTHSTPFIGGTLSRVWVALCTVAARSRLMFAALGAKLCCGTACSAGCGRRLLRWSGLLLGRSCVLHGICHRLADSHSRAEACANSDCSTALVGRGARDRLSNLVLRELVHVADHIHADALIENFLQLVGQRKIFDVEGVERKAVVGESRRELLGDFLREHALIRRHVEER